MSVGPGLVYVSFHKDLQLSPGNSRSMAGNSVFSGMLDANLPSLSFSTAHVLKSGPAHGQIHVQSHLRIWKSLLHNLYK